MRWTLLWLLLFAQLQTTAAACTRIEAGLRLQMASARALIEIDIVAADAVERPRSQPGEMRYEVVQHATGRVRERVYGDWPYAEELSLHRRMLSDPQGAACEEFRTPLKQGSRCYVWARHDTAVPSFDCSEDLYPFADTQTRVRALARELEARTAMTEADWEALLQPLEQRLQEMAGAGAEGCIEVLKMDGNQPLTLRENYYRQLRCLHLLRQADSPPRWFIVDDHHSPEPRLLAMARSDTGPVRAFQVKLDLLSSDQLSLNPMAIEEADCADVVKRLDSFVSTYFCGRR